MLIDRQYFMCVENYRRTTTKMWMCAILHFSWSFVLADNIISSSIRRMAKSDSATTELRSSSRALTKCIVANYAYNKYMYIYAVVTTTNTTKDQSRQMPRFNRYIRARRTQIDINEKQWAFNLPSQLPENAFSCVLDAVLLIAWHLFIVGVNFNFVQTNYLQCESERDTSNEIRALDRFRNEFEGLLPKWTNVWCQSDSIQ